MHQHIPYQPTDSQDRWAWDHPHITKKIPDRDRITFPNYRMRKNRRSKEKCKVPVCSPMSLSDKLSNLHLLLRVSAFRRWPLTVRLFYEDAYDTWQSCHAKADAVIRSGIKIIFEANPAVDTPQSANLSVSSHGSGKRKRKALGQSSIDGIDVGYSYLEGPLEKSTFLLADGETINCSVCAKNIGLERRLSLICPAEGCKTASHLSCLGAKFLHDEGASDSIIPTSGKCPECNLEVLWVDLVKEMSLRIKGKKELAALTKKSRRRKANVPKLAKAGVVKTEISESEDAADTDTDSGSLDAAILTADAEDDLLQDNWRYQEYDDDNDDLTSITSAASGFSDGIDMPSPGKPSVAAPRLKTVIEDSE